MEKNKKSNFKTVINTTFLKKADNYFTKNKNKFNKDLERRDLMNDLLGSKSTIIPEVFKRKLKYWCDLRGLIYNPIELCNKSKSTLDRRIIYNVSHHDSTKKTEKIHIRLTMYGMVNLGIITRNKTMSKKEIATSR